MTLFSLNVLFLLAFPSFAFAADFLQTSGSSLVYKGQTVKLVGANLINIEALCSRYGAGGNWGSCDVDSINAREVDYERLAQEGGNHFRFGMAYRWYQDDKVGMFRVLDQHVEWARKHGVWIVWNVFTLPGDCYEGYTVQSCPFWNDTTMRNNFKQFWVDMADHYKNEPVVAGYDLVNEPLPPNGSYTIWKNYAQELVTAIRGVDANHLIFFTSLSDPSFPSKLTGTHIVYEGHDYTPMAMTHPGSSVVAYPGVTNEWCGSVLWSGKTIVGQSDTYNGTTYSSTSCNNVAKRYAIEWAKANNVPYYVGEWGPKKFGSFSGAYNYVKDRGQAYNNVFQVNHAYHSWKHSKDNWSIFPNQVETSASSMTPWYQEQLEAVTFSWAGNYRPNFASGATPISTATPSKTPTQQPSPNPSLTRIVSPTFTSVPNGVLSIESPLRLSSTSVQAGDIVTGTVTYKNTASTAVTIAEMVIAVRPPGGTNDGGPYYDLVPKATTITLQPGSSYTLTSSRTFTPSEPQGNWYAYSTYKVGTLWTDSPSLYTVNFSYSSVMRTPTPVGAKAGDGNYDGEVNGLDYVLWLMNVNTQHSQGSSKGDFNNDGKVDGLDYIVWLINYGK